jgi:outer membrane protein TolC
MRTQGVLVILFIFLATICCAAQLPSASAPAPPQDRQAPPINTTLPPSLEQFSGSGTVDKLVPGVIKLGLLDAIDRGLKHNLGLLLSQQQTELARAQYRRQLSALLPNVTGDVNESLNQINLAAFGIPLPAGLKSPVVGPFGIFDAHASMSETLLDFNAMNKVRAASEK